MSIDRRRFLQGGLNGGLLLGADQLFTGAGVRLVRAIVEDAFRRAEAAGVSGPTRNYINVSLNGAPARYTFDAWLATHSADAPMNFNPMTGTQILPDGTTQYATINGGNGLQVPALWGQNVLLSGGRTKSLKDLLPNMLVVRGFGTGVDGHAANFLTMMKPVTGLPSMSGLAADGSTGPFAAVQWPDRGGASAYASGKGIPMSKVTSANKPLHKLLEGIRTTSSTRTLRKTLADEIDLAKARLKAYASEDTKAAKAARGSMDATLKAIKQGVGDLDGYWNAAVARYRDVVYGNMRTSGLVGINQNAIPSDGTSLRFRVFATDGRTYILHPSFDSRQITAEMSTPYYAEGLVLAEYVYMNGYVTSLEIYAGELENLMIREAGQAASFRTGATKDMHETGSAMTVLLTNMYYRGLAAGLLEFAEKLKTKTVEGRSVWAETVVQFTSEFNRAARSDASGSDHGFNQMVTSAFSGAFTNGPEVVGNIKRTGLNDSTYAGTQGIAAAIPGYTHSGAPSPIMVASTMTSLIGGGYNPWLNLAAPLVTLTNGVLTPTFGRGKITEE